MNQLAQVFAEQKNNQINLTDSGIFVGLHSQKHLLVHLSDFDQILQNRLFFGVELMLLLKDLSFSPLRKQSRSFCHFEICVPERLTAAKKILTEDGIDGFGKEVGFFCGSDSFCKFFNHFLKRLAAKYVRHNATENQVVRQRLIENVLE